MTPIVGGFIGWWTWEVGKEWLIGICRGHDTTFLSLPLLCLCVMSLEEALTQGVMREGVIGGVCRPCMYSFWICRPWRGDWMVEIKTLTLTQPLWISCPGICGRTLIRLRTIGLLFIKLKINNN